MIQRVLEFFEKHQERSSVKVGISAKDIVVFTRADIPRLKQQKEVNYECKGI